MPGTLPHGAISVIDISLSGAKVQHPFPLAAGRRVRLEFSLRGERISLSGEVVRCRVERAEANTLSYASGIRFSDADEIRKSSLSRILAEIVARDLAERRRGNGVPDPIVTC